MQPALSHQYKTCFAFNVNIKQENPIRGRLRWLSATKPGFTLEDPFAAAGFGNEPKREQSEVSNLTGDHHHNIIIAVCWSQVRFKHNKQMVVWVRLYCFVRDVHVQLAATCCNSIQ